MSPPPLTSLQFCTIKRVDVQFISPLHQIYAQVLRLLCRLNITAHHSVTMKIYSRARENQTTPWNPAFRPLRIRFLQAAGLNFVLLQLLFLGLFSYLFGSLYQQDSNVHNLHVLFVDYDGGIIGSSVRSGYKTLQSNNFPTLVEHPPTQFPSPVDIERKVCQARYWAAIYVSPEASTRLQAALAGDSIYNSSDVFTYIWNEARYPATSDSLVSNHIQTLFSAARVAFVSNETEANRALSANTSAAISIFANPWEAVSINIMPTVQGSRLIYNTIVIILILLQEFFYLGTLNGLSQSFEFFQQLPPHRIIFFRFGISVAYTFIGSLCTTVAIWAFRAGWGINGNQFALSWAAFWLFAHINFLVFDVFTAWLPLLYVPMSLVTWVVFNITSILLPFELIPGFYHWSYALPANEVYRTLLDIWSGGCYPQLHISLPVLFSWEIAVFVFSSLGIYRRCHLAIIARESQQKAFHEKLDAALLYVREHAQEDQTSPACPADRQPPTVGITSRDGADQEAERRLSEATLHRNELLAQSETRSNQAAGFAPCFDILLSNTASSLKYKANS